MTTKLIEEKLEEYFPKQRKGNNFCKQAMNLTTLILKHVIQQQILDMVKYRIAMGYLSVNCEYMLFPWISK